MAEERLQPLFLIFMLYYQVIVIRSLFLWKGKICDGMTVFFNFLPYFTTVEQIVNIVS